ncbi:MAG TPA: phosphoglycerate mutase family protein [Saprospiraceae bacterium]|nr:phosphoglycerate mutase family protein [Saprospiraceae bacterium]
MLSKLCVFILIATFAFSNCSKGPEAIIKTVTKIDTIYIAQTDTVKLIEYINDSTTTFILSRHAETSGAGMDPSLSVTGQERAIELARVLHTTPIRGVYSTNYKRTKETAAPLAEKNNLTTQIYDPEKLSQLIDQLLLQYKNQVVYVVGHSNTTNVLLNTLVGNPVYPDIPENEYNNLYIVSVSEKGNARVVHLKYGK